MSFNLSELLENKTFDELTSNERRQVLTVMRKTEYNLKRNTIITAKEIIQEEEDILIPNLQISIHALAALKAKQQKKKRGAFGIFQHKVPTWLAVAACMLLFLIVKGANTKNVVNKYGVLSNAIDTVYVEKLITQTEEIILPPDTVIKVIYKTVVTTEKENITERTPFEKSEKEPLFTDAMLNIGSIDYSQLISNHSETKGINIRNDSLIQMANNSFY